jgi:hypothetical protein
MPIQTIHTDPQSSPVPTLHVALDLGNTTWCLAGGRLAPSRAMFPTRPRAVYRLRGLLALHGIRLTSLRAVPDQLPHLTQWDGEALATGCSSATIQASHLHAVLRRLTWLPPRPCQRNAGGRPRPARRRWRRSRAPATAAWPSEQRR